MIYLIEGGITVNFNVPELLKLPTKIIVAICIATGSILFLPNKLIEKMYMTNFRNKYGFIIGIVFIISASILIVSFAIRFYEFINEMYSKKKFDKNIKKLLQELDAYKRLLVYGLYTQDNHTSELPLNDGAVIYLEKMMVINKATTQYAVSDLQNPVFPYFLQPWVIKELDNNEELLKSYERDANKKMKELKSEINSRGYNYY